MPFATALGTLTLFLVLAYLLPAVTIFSAILVLFPDLPAILRIDDPLLAASAVLVVAFVHGFPCQLIEFCCFDPLWSRMWPKYSIEERKELAKNRSSVISKAEALSISHAHFDQTIGEYILFFNAGLWVVILALIKLIGSVFYGLDFAFPVAWVMLLAALVSVLFVSPLYKKRYLDILEVIQTITDEKERTSTHKPSSAGSGK